MLLSSAWKPGIPDSHVIAVDSLEDRTVTIGDLRDRAGRLANGLKQAFAPKDQSRWAVILPTCVTFTEIVHAVLWQDGVFCPINWELQASEIASAFDTIKPDFAIIYAKIVPVVLNAVELAKKKDPSFKEPTIIAAVGDARGYPRLNSFLGSGSLSVPHDADTRRRLASIHLSSGTTGKAKGVGLTHFNYVSQCYQLHVHDPNLWSPTHSSMAITPMAHIANTTKPHFLGPWIGIKHILMDKFNPEVLCQLIERHKVQDCTLLPPLVPLLVSGDLMKKYDLSSIRFWIGGGGLKQDFIDRVRKLHKFDLVNLYGMNEAAGYAVWSKSGQSPPGGQIGFLLPNIDARLCDAVGNDVPVGGEGELWLRGPNMTKGYVQNPEANASAFKDGDWYNTGDVCKITPDGYVSVVGRTKELFKSSGFQVSPQELEAYLISHPDIQEVSVGPTYDDAKSTDVATGHVVLKPHLAIATNEFKLRALESIQKFLNGKVSGYKKLRGGVFEVTAFPKNGTGKILRPRIGEKKTGLAYLPSIKSKL